MLVTVNGTEQQLDEARRVADLVSALGGGTRGVAVAVNEVVVPRSCWADHELCPGDRVEVLRAMQGG